LKLDGKGGMWAGKLNKGGSHDATEVKYLTPLEGSKIKKNGKGNEGQLADSVHLRTILTA